MAEVQLVQPNVPVPSKEQVEGLAQWTRNVNPPLEDVSADALWGANVVGKRVVGITAPVAAKLLEMLKLKQSLGVIQ